MKNNNHEHQGFLNRSLEDVVSKIRVEHLIIFLIILFAVVSRLVNLGDRVMSHDEVNHVVPAFDLYAGRGYRHDPITHGPFQFHLMALSYFLFGDNDFTSRLPHAIFSIASVAFILIYFRRYLGKIGALAAGLFFTISPFLLFYGRYARNEAICAFLGITSIYAILRYFETRKSEFLYFISIALAVNFSTKETAYIFSAQLLIFFLILAIKDVFDIKQENKSSFFRFILLNTAVVVGVLISLGISIYIASRGYQNILQAELGTSTPVLTGQINDLLVNFLPLLRYAIPVIVPLAFCVLFLIWISHKLNWSLLARSSGFDLLILVGTLVLPLLAPFPVRFAGIDPIAYSDPYVLMTNYIYLVFLACLSIIFGTAWRREEWWKLAVPFFGIYFIFYTTFFTNGMGLITGMIGSLGHWLSQQSVQRGGQPVYYFAAILIPIYEFLVAIGTMLAFGLAIRRRSFWQEPETTTSSTRSASSQNPPVEYQNPSSKADLPDLRPPLLPIPAIFIFISMMSLIAFTLAGEKMPWLAVHITFPMVLASGWAINEIFRKSKDSPIHFVVVGLLVISLFMVIHMLWGNHAPFRGKTSDELQDTMRFIFLTLTASGLAYWSYRIYQTQGFKQFIRTATICLFGFLVVITGRSAYRAAYINYDYPYEFLVYAHAADAPKRVLSQIEDISRRTTNGLDIKVAYDNHGLYPYWWYLRHYPNKIVYLENPTRSLEEAPLIIAGSDKYSKIDAIVKDNYYSFEYMRLWWPMQDYWNLNWERISSALKSADMRQALFNIWFNRDYSLYAQITSNRNLTLENWLPSERMRFYIRKDIASQIWEYATEDSLQSIVELDPYLEKIQDRKPDHFIGTTGSLPGELNAPRGIAIAPDGTLFVADSRNHRIQHLSTEGRVLNVWGSYASILEGNAPGGTFSEPWGVAVSPDGYVFVADTFNHRIQKFTLDGRFIKMWGIFRQGDDPESLWGPRDITIDQDGRVLVTDTGNKRVVVFDGDLNFITQFGTGGFEVGQFDEPVGIAVNSDGQVVVADTWNRRVQIFQPDSTGLVYNQVGGFDVSAWYGQGINNKPFVAVNPSGHILVSDPDSGRVLEFSWFGELIQGWENMAPTSEMITQPAGLDFDDQGNLWISDASSNLLMKFNYP